jgi:hypothetical protein
MAQRKTNRLYSSWASCEGSDESSSESLCDTMTRWANVDTLYDCGPPKATKEVGWIQKEFVFRFRVLTRSVPSFPSRFCSSAPVPQSKNLPRVGIFFSAAAASGHRGMGTRRATEATFPISLNGEDFLVPQVPIAVGPLLPFPIAKAWWIMRTVRIGPGSRMKFSGYASSWA